MCEDCVLLFPVHIYIYILTVWSASFLGQVKILQIGCAMHLDLIVSVLVTVMLQ